MFPSPLRGLIFHFKYCLYGTLQRKTFFRPLFGDLSSISLKNLISHQTVPFRPLFGDLSSISLSVGAIQQNAYVSVPSSGTYLPFRKQKITRDVTSSFRPLFGDLSSISKESKDKENALKKFPSPLRGLIFHFRKKGDETKMVKKVSVPSSGTYLPFHGGRYG